MDEMIKMENDLTQGAGEVEIVDDSVEESVGIDEYSISSYGADFDVEGIIRRFKRCDIEIPVFQRRSVWTKPQASKFVESLLLGLPVPGIFLYREDDTRKLIVIDGQQRIHTLNNFYKEPSKDIKPFRLSGLESRFNGVAYKDLGHDDRRKLDDSIIHATIIRQEKPEDDDSSKYAIFERLNTGGTRLAPQEIRSAIHNGPFCELLTELNKNESWRNLFGNIHKRKRDEELILRFLALFYESDNYHRPMARFLNEFMKRNRNLECQKRLEMKSLFTRTASTILDKIGDEAFKPLTAVNAAVLDAVMVGVAMRLQSGAVHNSIEAQYKELLNSSEFIDSVSVHTSQREKVQQRISLAIKAFAEAE